MADARAAIVDAMAREMFNRLPQNKPELPPMQPFGSPAPATLSQGPAPTGRDRVFDGVYGALGGKPENRWAADKLTTAFDVGTLGMATGAYDGGRELAQTGRPAALATAVMPGARVPGMAAKAATTAVREAVPGIRAYHGSPHDFDRFDMSKIGTGEGAQAFGHGLYFAEKEGVAANYRENLTAGSGTIRAEASTPYEAQARAFVEPLASADGASLSDMRAELAYEVKKGRMDRNVMSAFDDMVAGGRLAIERNPGRMYEVNINAHPDDFLDWDKPLSQQSEKVRQAFVDVPQAPDIPGQLAYYRKAGELTGRKSISSPEVSAKLREAGIPGIKYLDQGSRTAGEGSRNYVVFDDAMIEILRKYGLVPPGMLAAIAAQSGQQLMGDQEQ